MDAASTTLELQPGRDGGVLMQRMVRWMRQRLCRRHGCHLNELRRTPDGGVECPCIRCGKMLTGHYGLMLECDWIPIPPNAGTQRPGSPDESLATETRKPGSLK